MDGSSKTRKSPLRDAASKIAQQRMSVLELARELGNVAEARRQRGMVRSASSQPSMIGMNGSSFGRRTSAIRRSLEGTKNVIIFATVSREMLNAFTA